MNDDAAFTRMISALQPWHRQVVVVGGWAHRLHRLVPTAQPVDYQPLVTRDADVAFGLHERLEGDIGAALRTSGFHEELSGEFVPPVSHFRFGGDDQGFYVEFLAPQLGGAQRRDGTPDATVFRAGVSAQKLRHLNLLLCEPWTVTVPGEPAATIRIANPVTFIAQKLLIAEARPPHKRAQDILYIHDTLDLFGGDLDALGTLWHETLRPTVPGRTASTVEARAKAAFTQVSDDIRTAARIPPDRQLSPDRMQQALSQGLGIVFGTGR